jgi:hypothetical protein
MNDSGQTTPKPPRRGTPCVTHSHAAVRSPHVPASLFLPASRQVRDETLFYSHRRQQLDDGVEPPNFARMEGRGGDQCPPTDVQPAAVSDDELRLTARHLIDDELAILDAAPSVMSMGSVRVPTCAVQEQTHHNGHEVGAR